MFRQSFRETALESGTMPTSRFSAPEKMIKKFATLPYLRQGPFSHPLFSTTLKSSLHGLVEKHGITQRPTKEKTSTTEASERQAAPLPPGLRARADPRRLPPGPSREKERRAERFSDVFRIARLEKGRGATVYERKGHSVWLSCWTPQQDFGHAKETKKTC